MSVPFFRKMVRAIGEHNRPAETAYRYELIEFWPSGAFKRVPNIQITKTQMRMTDENRHFEEQVAGDWKLIDAYAYTAYRIAWDEKRCALGYDLINDEGI